MAATSVAYILFLALFAVNARACSVPPGGCKMCENFKSLDGVFDPAKLRNSPAIGVYLGAYNVSGLLSKKMSEKGSPGMNFEYYTTVKTASVIAAYDTTSVTQCCVKCRTNPKCIYYQVFQSLDDAMLSYGFSKLAASKKKTCLLLNGAYIPKNAGELPRQLEIANGSPDADNFAASYFGGRCNVQSTGDPHMIGGHGTPFDWNGKLDRSFCLTTDRKFQINAMMRGYEDARQQGATVLSNGKALRTWIRELGLLWVAADGSKHNLHLVARDGVQRERGNGFLSKVVVDGEERPCPKLGEAVTSDGGLVLTLKSEEKLGWFDVDVYTLQIAGVAKIELRMRVAHPALQAPDNAEAHFNLYLHDIGATDAIHGVLGQTFRETTDRLQRAMDYSAMAKLLRTPVSADGLSGRGFLDGEVNDYVTPDILSPGCKYNTFGQ